MTNKKVKYENLLFVFVLLVCCLFTPFSYHVSIANAESTYTSVITDLQKDKDFNLSDYSVIEEDYSLQVIQIAETTENELLVYVYQPSANKTAVSINISTAINDNLKYINYKLTLLNSQDVLQKYIVNDFVVKSDAVRYYDISSIFRVYEEDIDKDPNLEDNGNIITEKSFAVGKMWTACTIEGNITYSCVDTEIIEIAEKDKYVGFVRYTDGFHLVPNSEAIDSHFVAFSTSRPIDKLIEADVYYTSQYVYYYYYIGDYKYAFYDIEENYVTLRADKEEHFTGGGLFAPVYKWKEIQSISEFFETENSETIYECGLFNVKQRTKLTEQGKKDLQGKQWVLRFANTGYGHSATGGNSGDYTIIADVSILRLTFQTDGKVYNLGVVDNKQTGDGVPDNTTSTILGLPWWVYLIIAVVLLVLFVIFFPSLFVGLIKCIFKGIWFVLTIPYKLMSEE